jgi:hypothetical protein
MVSTFQTANYTADRGIKMIDEYNSKITTNEEQKQFLLQIVSNYRTIFLNCKKET